MTVDNVTQILNKITGHKWEEVMGGLGLDIPRPLLEEIKRRCSTDTEKSHACADYYVNCHPQADWKDLTVDLYFKEEFALARESKLFMSTGKYTATSSVYAKTSLRGTMECYHQSTAVDVYARHSQEGWSKN